MTLFAFSVRNRNHRRPPLREAAAAAMGIDWMTGGELNEAIPPAYTEYVGAFLRAALTLRRAA